VRIFVAIVAFHLGSADTRARDKPAVEKHCLVVAYPGIVCSVAENIVHFCDGTTLPFDDGRSKTHQEQLVSPDLQDQLHIPYRRSDAPPELDEEAGRIRYDPFFKKLYGASSQEVLAQITKLRWFPSSSRRFVRFSATAGAASALAAVAKELALLPRKLRKHIKKAPQTFVWRKIRKTDRLSPHSFGIALDISVQWSDYWQWQKADKHGRFQYRNRIPLEIVQIFEKHGFIWGGRWYRFDTMHFEYRPELLIQGCQKR
jgi:hypothetical protein